MAINVGAAIGGIAKSLSKGFEDERKEALELATQKIKILTELGLPKARARKEALRSKNELFDKLSRENFSVPQISVIMREGKGEAVLEHIDKQRSLYKNYKLNPADIVAISPDFKDTGLTKDMVLENVMGKINKGMSPTGAMNDTFGTSLTNRFGGNLGNVGKRQMQSIADATGVSIEELQALAADDITKADPLVEGTVSLYDPVAAKRARDTMEDTAGLLSTNSFNRTVRQHALAFSGSNSTLDQNNNLIYAPQQATRALQADTIANEELAKYQKETGKAKFDNTDIQTITGRINDRLKELDIYIGPASNQPVIPPGQGQGQQGQGQGQQGQGQGSNPYTGLGGGVTNISNQVIRDAKGKSAQQQTTILAQARQAIVAALTQNATPGTSAQSISDEADRIIADIQSKL
jgi:hypothetical protein